mmetsp:Transcript_104645/g.293273  ORF Transcript_104645/g.293273 Transcript_104645/m.293273 type:complete len:86 (-) Transcript_104645:107-364(-)
MTKDILAIVIRRVVVVTTAAGTAHRNVTTVDLIRLLDHNVIFHRNGSLQLVIGDSNRRGRHHDRILVRLLTFSSGLGIGDNRLEE